MKDAKQFSDRAARFLPVDMKDRLKTIFNRTPSRGPDAADDDVPDYSAIFNANKVPGQKRVRFNGPLEPPQLAEPPARATMKETGMQRAQDIEDAEIVPEAINEPLVRAELEEQPATASMEAEAPAPKEESFAQRAAAKAKALAASAEEAIKSRTASRRAAAPAEEEPVLEESFAHRGPSKPKATAPAEEDSFAHRAAPKKSEAPVSPAADSFAYRAAPNKPEAPVSPAADSFAHRGPSKPMAAAPAEEDSFAYRAAPKKPEAPVSSEAESFAYRAAPKKAEPKVEERKPEPRVEAPQAEQRKPEPQHFTSEMWRSHEQELKAEEQRREEPKPAPRAQAEEPMRDDSGLESRFGKLSSSEHVRLKVDPRRSEERRSEERQPEEAAPMMASSGSHRASEPVRPHRETAESKPRTTEEHTAAGFASESKPLEQPRETHRSSGETAAPRATASERNLHHQQKETSMYAKGQQQEAHENGTATVRNEGANLSSIAIERNSKFSGQLKFSGAIAIDGQVEGELVAERVVVHEGGTVNATIEGNTVVVAGTVKGDIYARAELEVLPSGVIHGSVTTPAINVRRGGRIDGRCTIGAPRQ